MTRVTAVIALAALLAALTAQPQAVAQETIYKWMDEEGVVHYTARPPEGIDYEVVDVRNSDQSGDQSSGAEGESGDDGASASSVPPEQPEMAASEPDPEMVAERCEQARRNVENLTQRSNVLIAGDDGERRQITDEERETMLEDARAFMDEWC